MLKKILKRITVFLSCIILIMMMSVGLSKSTYASDKKLERKIINEIMDEKQGEVKLYPAPKEYQMGGIPAGMTEKSFNAGAGTMRVTPLDKKRTKVDFEFSGLIPNGVYTLWNVTSELPNFKEEPLGTEGYGNHGVIADDHGHAHAVVYLDKRPGDIFLLDYHSDGKLTGEKGKVVFSGALWGRFPKIN